MTLYSENENYKLYQGNMLDMLEAIDPESIDSIVTDPPYELGFMGKSWDGSGVAFQKESWERCYKVLKSGGYLLAFGGSRTFHRIACAIEDAGFEIRDTIMWLYGSGFPKSMDISKSLDKRNGRFNNDFIEFGKFLKEKRGNRPQKEISKYFLSKAGGLTGCVSNWELGKNVPTLEQYKLLKEKLDLDNRFDWLIEREEAEREVIGKGKAGLTKGTIANFAGTTEFDITIPSTDLAKQWQGWGTALKPAYEPVIVARKPFKGSCVDNVVEYGVGGINIDECRIGDEERTYRGMSSHKPEGAGTFRDGNWQPKDIEITVNGRFPANVILTYDETSDERLRYFANCKYTEKDKEIWKQLLVNNVGSNLEISKATKDNIAQMNVEGLLKELKDHYAKYVENQLELTGTPIVQDIVEMLTWDFKIETSPVIRGFITNSTKCTQLQSLVQFVERMDSIDTTQTTQSLLRLFGYVKAVITNYILGNLKFEQIRYIYAPKASKKDRDEGLDGFEEKTKIYNGKSSESSKEMKDVEERFTTKLKNTHPTVKPTSLMQYLVRLVTPRGGVVLDPFNGSGSTGKAVMYENAERNKGYKYIGIELTEEYLPIAKARIEGVKKPKAEKELTLFEEVV